MKQETVAVRTLEAARSIAFFITKSPVNAADTPFAKTATTHDATMA